MHGPSEGISEETDEANSAVKLSAEMFCRTRSDHPGFKDEGYRSRRNEIAKIALEWNEMSMDERRSKKIPHAPYSEDEDAVWAAIMERITPVHEKYACKQYLENAKNLGLPNDRIPQLQVSERLEEMTGLRQEPVGGLVHQKTFHTALANEFFFQLST